jgi:hypothetical protein
MARNVGKMCKNCVDVERVCGGRERCAFDNERKWSGLMGKCEKSAGNGRKSRGLRRKMCIIWTNVRGIHGNMLNKLADMERGWG